MNIGIIGAGMIGGTLGRLWVKAGHSVRFGVRHPNQLRTLLKQLGDTASAGTPSHAVKEADVVLAAFPFRAWPEIASDVREGVRGKVVMDATVPDPPRDGDFGERALASKEGVAFSVSPLLPEARLVRAFSTVMWTTLMQQAHRNGDRIGIPLAGDDNEAVNLAAMLAREAGFDPVEVGGLAKARLFDPGMPVFDSDMTGPQVRSVFHL